MKKLAFVLLIMMSCSGIFPEKEIIIESNYSSPLTITGLYKSINSGLVGLLYDNIRNAINGEEADANTEYGITSSWEDFYLSNHIARIGMIFDISSLPENIVIDSIQVKVYCTAAHWDGGDNLGAVLYSADAITCIQDDLSNYATAVGSNAGLPVFKELDIIENIAVGYQTFTAYNLPISGIYGDNYASFGLGCYQYDYIFESPPWFVSSFIDWYLFSATNQPQLIIYYSGFTPAPKKIKIIEVI
jgi:hypothetical protein